MNELDEIETVNQLIIGPLNTNPLSTFEMLEEVLKDKIKHSFLQDFPTKFESKMCPPPFCFPPLKFENLVPPAPPFCGSAPLPPPPHCFLIFKFCPTQNFQLMNKWFAQTDH